VKLRLSLTISGGVSLGAYEAGVLAALLIALRDLTAGDDPPVRVDVIGGSSAGSITGLLAARCLLEGIDPLYVMREAWVRRASLDAMRSRRVDAPLTMRPLRDMAIDLLDPRAPDGSPVHRVDTRQDVPIMMVMALASLRSLHYRMPSLAKRTNVSASTSLDWGTFEFTPGQAAPELLEPVDGSPVDFALASAANPLAFPPRLLDRRREEAEYQEHGIANFPDSGYLWYTDGGMLDSQPLTRTLELANVADRDPHFDGVRLGLLVHPHTTGAPKGDAWADPTNPPTWLATLLRARDRQNAQTLYDDFRALEDTNARLEWRRRLFAEIGPALDALDGPEADALRDALASALGVIAAQHDAMRARRADPADAAALSIDRRRPLSDLLHDAVSHIAGISGKRPIAVEVISPMVLPEARTTPVARMMAGEFMFGFGGFLDEELRQSDFDLGYRSTLEWIDGGGFRAHGLPDALDEAALAAARDAYTPGRTWMDRGNERFRSLSRSQQVALAPLGWQLARVFWRDLRRPRPQDTAPKGTP